MAGTGQKRAFSSRGYLTRMTSRRKIAERKEEHVCSEESLAHAIAHEKFLSSILKRHNLPTTFSYRRAADVGFLYAKEKELALEDLKKISEMLSDFSWKVIDSGGWFDYEENAAKDKLNNVIESRSRRGKQPSGKFKKE